MTKSVLVIGGKSRAALAFRRYIAQTRVFDLIVLVRTPSEALAGETLRVVSDYFSPNVSLSGVAAAVNFAGIMRGREDELNDVNASGPICLAKAVKASGVGHFVHISSLSVYGRAEEIGRDTPVAPVTAYGRSKVAGDTGLASLAGPGFIVTLLRVPILYGCGRGGKLGQLASAMSRLGAFPVPSQLAQRSTLHFDNLAVAIRRVIDGGLSGIQFAADSEPFTIAALAEELSRAGRRVRLIVLPGFVLASLRATMPGLYASLYGKSLIRAEKVAGDAPLPLSLAEGLADLIG